MIVYWIDPLLKWQAKTPRSSHLSKLLKSINGGCQPILAPKRLQVCLESFTMIVSWQWKKLWRNSSSRIFFDCFSFSYLHIWHAISALIIIEVTEDFKCSNALLGFSMQWNPHQKNWRKLTHAVKKTQHTNRWFLPLNNLVVNLIMNVTHV